MVNILRVMSSFGTIIVLVSLVLIQRVEGRIYLYPEIGPHNNFSSWTRDELPTLQVRNGFGRSVRLHRQVSINIDMVI